MRTWCIVLLGGLLGVLGSLSGAQAQPEWIIGQASDEIRFTDLTLSSLFDGGYGFGFTPGVQMGIPVLEGGFIPALNDSFFIEPGLLVSMRFRRDAKDLVWVVPEVGPRWNFHLTPSWDAFVTCKLGWAIGTKGDFWIRGTLGTNWWFVAAWALRAEFSAGAVVGPGGSIGLSYRFL
jgi:hypothetical protein